MTEKRIQKEIETGIEEYLRLLSHEMKAQGARREREYLEWLHKEMITRGAKSEREYLEWLYKEQRKARIEK